MKLPPIADVWLLNLNSSYLQRAAVRVSSRQPICTRRQYLPEHFPAMIITLLEVWLEPAVIHIRVPLIRHAHVHLSITGALVASVVIICPLVRARSGCVVM